MELAMTGGSKIKVSDEVFGRDFSQSLVHQVVTAYLAGGRSGTKAQKNRSAVSGGGRKPWRQKGTGNARAGTIRSPLWRSGGVTFAAQPRDFTQKVNRKQYRAAIKSILSELVRQERLVVVEKFEFAEPRTRLVREKLAELGVVSGVLIDVELDDNLYLGSRNIPGIQALTVEGLNPVSLVGADKVVVSKAAVNKIEEWLA
ncbi:MULTISPECIES: 50S ribosomal protein L4 [unclassified Wenzhouxiangella]|uniref:50S ribosomal protein L4 n=1 Tax=unclassified Wenzhouxiangella TaxID=2613841 RepID=UPI000E32D21C|nr:MULTISPECIES: 50S ribosomal protein L4 [unclassified Wenzhouxiangella]RFF26474.1 50S ribosomal protein L4 [Wenzhouxiangella sp. 15181]RFP67253.1 50S ribosomal protein L4 [Wenzhouxiangella sp. 15190]